jgi:hypothetical protein
MITGEILRGLRHNYVAEALRMTFCSLSVNCCLLFFVYVGAGKKDIMLSAKYS